MRAITEHRVNPANDKLAIDAVDQPGSGGANHRYTISGFDLSTNPSASGDGAAGDDYMDVVFQNGPIGEVGVNGVTHEALLAILVDRMRAFQAGPFSCRENALALTKLEEAQQWLQARTRGRMSRGVEGTHAA